jgi:uncharacterized YigZ family protein
MKYIKTHFQNTYEVKQSKFIAHLVMFANYEDSLKTLKELHPKARHFVVAYRYLNEFKQVVEHSSDDGEPKGTSGKPTLMVLQGQNLINTAIIIVRYFGGTKLGTGGLVRAYSEATSLVIRESELFEYMDEIVVTLSFSYSDIRKVEYECKINNIKIIEKVFKEVSIYKFQAPKEYMKTFLASIPNYYLC